MTAKPLGSNPLQLLGNTQASDAPQSPKSLAPKVNGSQKVRRALRSPGRNMIFGAVKLTIRTATSVIGFADPLRQKLMIQSLLLLIANLTAMGEELIMNLLRAPMSCLLTINLTPKVAK